MEEGCRVADEKMRGEEWTREQTDSDCGGGAESKEAALFEGSRLDEYELLQKSSDSASTGRPAKRSRVRGRE